MILHNTGPHSLKWDMGGRTFEADPFGPVDVPDRLVKAARRRGLPLSTSPLGGEEKASRKAALEATKAAGAETHQLKKALAESKGNLDAARDELEAEKHAHGKLKSRCADAEKKLKAASAALEAAHLDNKALEEKTRELAEKLVAFEDKPKAAPKPAAKSTPKKRR